MERRLVVEDDDLQIWRITAKIMKQSWTADEGRPSTLADGYQLIALQNVTQALQRGQIL
jgi:hypothetical protein